MQTAPLRSSTPTRPGKPLLVARSVKTTSGTARPTMQTTTMPGPTPVTMRPSGRRRQSAPTLKEPFPHMSARPSRCGTSLTGPLRRSLSTRAALRLTPPMVKSTSSPHRNRVRPLPSKRARLWSLTLVRTWSAGRTSPSRAHRTPKSPCALARCSTTLARAQGATTALRAAFTLQTTARRNRLEPMCSKEMRTARAIARPSASTASAMSR